MQKKTIFRVNFFRYIEFISCKTYFNCFGGNCRWAHKIDNGNWKKFFRKELLWNASFVKILFEWHSYQWAYRRPMIEKKNHSSELFFLWKTFLKEKDLIVCYEVSISVQTNDDGKKTFYRMIIFFQKVFF